jgi:hypothetical protein
MHGVSYRERGVAAVSCRPGVVPLDLMETVIQGRSGRTQGVPAAGVCLIVSIIS